MREVAGSQATQAGHNGGFVEKVADENELLYLPAQLDGLNDNKLLLALQRSFESCLEALLC